MGVIAHGATLFNENVNELKKEKYKKLKGQDAEKLQQKKAEVLDAKKELAMSIKEKNLNKQSRKCLKNEDIQPILIGVEEEKDL